MPTRGSKDPNGRALRGRRAHTTFALLTDPARQIWNSFNNRANAGSADAPEAAVNGCLYDRFKSLYTKTATKPSLVIVPARFKSGTLYSQIPSSNADFTVTRNTAARRFDSAGLIESVASGIPRLDYYTSGGVTGCPALLVEPAATNLHTHSEAFDQNYTAIATSASGTNLTAPDNSATADRYLETAANSTHVIALAGGGAGFPVTSGLVYTASVFIKSVGGRNARFSLTNAGSGNVLYTLSGDGTVSNSAIGAIQNFGNDWYRCAITFTATGTTNFRQSIFSVSGSTDSFTGDVTKGLILWGGQLETGSVATSYIPTTAGTGSRSADVISVSGAVSGSIGQTAGTAYLEIVAVSGTNSGRVLSLTESGAPTNNRIAFTIDASNHRLEVIVRSSGSITNGSIGSSAATLLVNGVNKIAYAYDGVAGNNALAINGSVVATNSQTLAFTQALSRVNVAILESDLTVATNQRIRAVALYTTRLTNAELQSLTIL
jgi:hypothetical protein